MISPTRSKLVLICFAAFAFVLAARAQSTVASGYSGRILIQRQFVAGPHPVYDADGTRISGDLGPWTTSAEIQVRNVHADGNSLLVEGRRMLLLYDRESRQFRDVFDVIEAPDAYRFMATVPKRKQLDQLREQQAVTVEIRRPDGWNDATIKAAMERVFLSSSEHLSDIAPPEWKPFLCRMDYGEEGMSQCVGPPDPVTAGPSRVGGRISAPKPRSTPDPQYEEEARRANLQGQTVLRLIVDREGSPQHVQIVRPLGLGLDEKAIDAVKRWRFDPAMKDGQPVSVLINVEVNFRLY